MGVHMQETTLKRKRVRHVLPAVLMRAGTSKGLFIHRKDLPASQDQWVRPLLAAMGSKNNEPRQIDGVGGATSTTSKVAIISPSQRSDADVEYTFAQVSVGMETVDFSGNCGNMASGVGPFALDERLVIADPGVRQVEVRIFNTNTSRIMVETVDVDENDHFEEDGLYDMAGVVDSGRQVHVAFVDPAGSVTGALFPSGNRVEELTVSTFDTPFTVQATLVDAANPFVFVNAFTLPTWLSAAMPQDQLYVDTVECIRRAGAIKMNMANNQEEAAARRGTPKIAIVWPSSSPGMDIQVQSFSMGKPHPSLQLTGAVCLGAAVCIDGTVPNLLSTSEALPTPERTPSPNNAETMYCKAPATSGKTRAVTVKHPGGSISVDADVLLLESSSHVVQCTVSRTARRLFEGNVLYYN
ncbi:DUF453-domain-containing protein [Pseudovirgaria hyperparasitica]|uniref:DUF453-domain-containing protein n=1 Tax=Pseudovirgaria hyperparasitica TaxID=470096 RepID=A0A6A6WF01_9PEZI|nr:DUF453-domain-containing protein [Pseudovirgaria hyperparasitica]KAF2761115.1 DUF453-domain-containing protein [Pseudovirgaria hyperparasitica]